MSPFQIRPTAGPDEPSLREERNARRERFLQSAEPADRFALALELSRDSEALGQADRAVSWNRHAHEEAFHLGARERALAAAQEGGICVRACRFADAEVAYRSALSATLGGEAPDERLGAEVREALGYTLVCRGRWTEGTSELFTALTVLEGLGEKTLAARTLLHLCFAFLRAGRAADSRWFGEEALSRLDGAAGSPLEKELLYLLGESCEQLHDAAAASAYRSRLTGYYPDFRNLRAYLEMLDLAPVLNLI